MTPALRRVIATEAEGRLEKSSGGPEARIGFGQTHSTSLRFAQGDKKSEVERAGVERRLGDGEDGARDRMMSARWHARKPGFLSPDRGRGQACTGMTRSWRSGRSGFVGRARPTVFVGWSVA